MQNNNIYKFIRCWKISHLLIFGNDGSYKSIYIFFVKREQIIKPTCAQAAVATHSPR